MIRPFYDSVAKCVGGKVKEFTSGAMEESCYLECPSIKEHLNGNHYCVTDLLHRENNFNVFRKVSSCEG